jgi:hypothetical protein
MTKSNTNQQRVTMSSGKLCPAEGLISLFSLWSTIIERIFQRRGLGLNLHKPRILSLNATAPTMPKKSPVPLPMPALGNAMLFRRARQDS